MSWKEAKEDWETFTKSPSYNTLASKESRANIFLYTLILTFFSLTKDLYINPFICWIVGIFLVSIIYSMPLFLLRSFLVILMSRTNFNTSFVRFFNSVFCILEPVGLFFIVKLFVK